MSENETKSVSPDATGKCGFLPTEDGEFNGNENWEGPLTDEEQGLIDAAWETHKAAKPAPVEGLETVEPLYGPKTNICWTQDNTPKEHRKIVQLMAEGDYVTRSQAEAIIAAKDAELKAAKEYGDKWFKYYSDLREPFELNEIERRKLETDNAALTARVKAFIEYEQEAEGIKEMQLGKIEALEAKLAAAEKALGGKP